MQQRKYHTGDIFFMALLVIMSIIEFLIRGICDLITFNRYELLPGTYLTYLIWKKRYFIPIPETALQKPPGFYTVLYSTPYDGQIIFVFTEDLEQYIRNGLKTSFEMAYLRRHEKTIDYMEKTTGQMFKDCIEIKIRLTEDQARPFIETVVKMQEHFMAVSGGNKFSEN